MAWIEIERFEISMYGYNASDLDVEYPDISAICEASVLIECLHGDGYVVWCTAEASAVG